MLHRAGQLLHRRRGLFQRGRLLFRALRQVGVALRDLGRRRSDVLTAVAHVLDDASQAFVHGLERRHQVAGFVARGDADIGSQVARGHLARRRHGLAQRTHDASRHQPPQQHADGHAGDRKRDHDSADRFVKIRPVLHGKLGGLFLVDRQVGHQVIELLRRRDDALFRFGHARVGVRQRLRLGRLEERHGLALPCLLGFIELRQQALGRFAVEILGRLVPQAVHGLDRIVELLAQRQPRVLGGGGQVGVTRTPRVDEVEVGFLQIRNAAQFGVVKPVIHFIDSRQPPYAERPDRTAYHRHQQKRARQA